MLLQGALIMLFLPILVFTTKEDIPPADIAMFGLMGRGQPGGARSALRSPALDVVGRGGRHRDVQCLPAVRRGPHRRREGYVATVFAAVAVLLLLLGKPAAGNTEALALASAKVPFRLKVTATWVAIFFILGIFLVLSDLDRGFIRENFRYIAGGLKYTILLAFFAIILATILALLGALGRLSHNAVAYGVSGFYTSFFRGTPLIVQLFLIYLALPQIGFNLDRTSLVTHPHPDDVRRRRDRPRAELRRIHDRDLPRGHPVRRSRTGGGRRRARDDLRAADAPRGAAAGDPRDHPAHRQRVHRDDEGHGARRLPGASGGERGAVPAREARVQRQRPQPLESLLVAAALYWLLTSVFTFFQSRLERRISKGYVRTEVGGGGTRRRTMWLPVGGDSSGAQQIEIEIPDEEDTP